MICVDAAKRDSMMVVSRESHDERQSGSEKGEKGAVAWSSGCLAETRHTRFVLGISRKELFYRMRKEAVACRGRYLGAAG